ncbi:17931_t:CDS:2 [Gigaspora margarita]|uniref:17931_t:CDS:1 n=1 Tax=Gigaspora margarita TaxID=4874 RepID=A0ABN7WS22_GIGMA|nr:17931_t:CDS:2 [Gigaspora margarita]
MSIKQNTLKDENENLFRTGISAFNKEEYKTSYCCFSSVASLNGFEQSSPEYFIMLNNKKYSTLSSKIIKLLQSNGLKVKPLNSTNKYSTIEVFFNKFYRNLFIWNKEIFDENDYIDLYKIASKFSKGNWLIVGSQLIDNYSEDK